MRRGGGAALQRVQFTGFAVLWETAAERIGPRGVGRLAGAPACERALDGAIGAVTPATLSASSPAIAARLPWIARRIATLPGGTRTAAKLATPSGRLYKLTTDLAKPVTKSGKARVAPNRGGALD